MSDAATGPGRSTKWVQEYRRAASDGSEPLWPSETLIRLFRGTYIPGMPKHFDGQSAIEVGCGNGNNLAFLGTLGLALAGTEIEADILAITRANLARHGLSADLRVGTNRKIPWAEGTFDYLVSWNVIHYEDNETAMREAIREYARVLKPDGRLLLSTTGPDHLILRGGETLGNHRYRIRRPDDFRRGQVFFYFDASNYIEYYFGEVFRDVRVGRTHDDLFTGTLDWFIVTGVK